MSSQVYSVSHNVPCYRQTDRGGSATWRVRSARMSSVRFHAVGFMPCAVSHAQLWRPLGVTDHPPTTGHVHVTLLQRPRAFGFASPPSDQLRVHPSSMHI